MRLVVTGGRKFSDVQNVRSNLAQFQEQYGRIDLLIHGDSEGLDRVAGWCAWHMFGIPVQVFPADWSNITTPGAVIKYRRGGQAYNALAGHWRNGNMITLGKPDWGMVFPGGTGTADMTTRLELAKIPIWRAN